jgi:hypothetical protein
MKQQLVNSAERTVVVADEGTPHQVDDDRLVSHNETTPWSPGRIVERPQYRERPIEMRYDLFLRPDMVAGGDYVSAGIQQFLRCFESYAGAMSRVFTIAHDEINGVFTTQAWQYLLNRLPARLADDISDDKCPQEGFP